MIYQWRRPINHGWKTQLIFNSMKKRLRRAWLHLKAETPLIWNWVAGVASTLPIAIAAINTATANTIIPEWYTNNQFYILGVAAAIAVYAKAHTTERGREYVNTKEAES